MMSDVICPICHSVTPPWRYCLVCNAPMDDLFSQGAEYASVLQANKPATGSDKSVDDGGRKMDARLRRIVNRTQEGGIRKLATSSTMENELAVIAKVQAQHLDRFMSSDPVRLVTPIAAEGDAVVVTARVPADRIEEVTQQDGVVSLKAAQRIRPLLERTTEEICADDMLPSDNQARGGSGVVIGIVDFGMDFTHRNFRNRDPRGTTRILALWDQKAPGVDQSPHRLGYGPFEYGRLFLKEEINAALQQDNPFKALGYEPPKDSIFDTGAHGTYVADVATGNGQGSSRAGIAPEADIVFVDASTAGTPAHRPQSVGSTFGDSVQLLEAIKFIFDFAGNRPCVINLSLGTNGGPHDGRTLVEKAIDRLIKDKPNRAVVVAAGNSFGEAIHAMGSVPAGGKVEIRWQIPPFDWTSNELELWYSGGDRFAVDVIDPGGKVVAHVNPGETWEKPDANSGLLTVVNRLRDPNNGENTVNAFFERGVRDGIWTLRICGDEVRDGRFHAWIERDERGQSHFVDSKDGSYQVSDEYTLSSIACGQQTIVVGAYSAHDGGQPMCELSSAGPTRDGRHKPEVSAPGERVLAARSGTVVLRHRQSGTSLAAATVTGVVALMLAEAQSREIPLSADRIRQILILAARGNPPGGDEWHPRYGFGRVCAATAVAFVRDLATYHQQPTPRNSPAKGQAPKDQAA